MLICEKCGNDRGQRPKSKYCLACSKMEYNFRAKLKPKSTVESKPKPNTRDKSKSQNISTMFSIAKKLANKKYVLELINYKEQYDSNYVVYIITRTPPKGKGSKLPSFVKVGYSKNVKNRLKDLQTGCFDNLRISITQSVRTEEEARLLEACCHASLRPQVKKQQGEWFMAYHMPDLRKVMSNGVSSYNGIVKSDLYQNALLQTNG